MHLQYLLLAANILVAGARPNNVQLGKAWDEEKKQRAEEYINDRKKYRSDTTEAISIIDTNFIETSLKADLMRSNVYTTALNRIRNGSILDYWDVLQTLLRSKIHYMKPGKSASNVIKQQILELDIDTIGDALAYYDKIIDLRNNLQEANIDSQIATTIAGIEMPDDILLALRNNVRQGVCDAIDGDSSIILKVWQEFSEHNDNNGAVKFKHLMTINNVPYNETPFTNRTVNGNVIYGGLNNLLMMAKENLDRIKTNNPTRKILFKRKEYPVGRDLKTSEISDANLSNALLTPNPKRQKPNTPTLESSDGVDES